MTPPEIEAGQSHGRTEVVALLGALGIRLDTALAPAFVLAAQDMLICIELAETLPDSAQYLPACSLRDTISRVQPEPVQLVQQAVARHYLSRLSDQAGGRLRSLLQQLDL